MYIHMYIIRLFISTFVLIINAVGFFNFNSSIMTYNSHLVRAGALMQWLKLPAWKIGDRYFEQRSGIQVSKKQKSLPRPLVNIQ